MNLCGLIVFLFRSYGMLISAERNFSFLFILIFVLQVLLMEAASGS
jgi:hypothetical protein